MAVRRLEAVQQPRVCWVHRDAVMHTGQQEYAHELAVEDSDSSEDYQELREEGYIDQYCEYSDEDRYEERSSDEEYDQQQAVWRDQRVIPSFNSDYMDDCVDDSLDDSIDDYTDSEDEDDALEVTAVLDQAVLGSARPMSRSRLRSNCVGVPQEQAQQSRGWFTGVPRAVAPAVALAESVRLDEQPQSVEQQAAVAAAEADQAAMHSRRCVAKSNWAYVQRSVHLAAALGGEAKQAHERAEDRSDRLVKEAVAAAKVCQCGCFFADSPSAIDD